ncbi:glycine zipper 2TM domain-containing protein [Synechococcus sp. NOUM97013]|nr:glycine zipper 2TM domain-containing protein [Synechococcus sp. NOUM97013]
MEGTLNGALMKRIVFASVAAALSVTAGLPATATPRWANAQPMHVYDYDQGYGRDRQTSLVAPDADTNSCLEGSVIGGLLGAGLGAVLSRGDGRWIGVPVGGAAGALLGCQVDGG